MWFFSIEVQTSTLGRLIFLGLEPYSRYGLTDTLSWGLAWEEKWCTEQDLWSLAMQSGGGVHISFLYHHHPTGTKSCKMNCLFTYLPPKRGLHTKFSDVETSRCIVTVQRILPWPQIHRYHNLFLTWPDCLHGSPLTHRHFSQLLRKVTRMGGDLDNPTILCARQINLRLPFLAACVASSGYSAGFSLASPCPLTAVKCPIAEWARCWNVMGCCEANHIILSAHWGQWESHKLQGSIHW
jgi:hypothetical protein